MEQLCVRCKGRGMCGKPCQILSKINSHVRELNFKEEFEGTSPPSVFIGSKLQYPEVNVGIMSLPEISQNAYVYDSPDYWSKQNVSSGKIIELRRSLVNSRFKSKVSDARKENKMLGMVQEIGMASLQADIEIRLEKKPNLSIQFNDRLLPMGPSAHLKNLKIISNTKIPHAVEKVYYDFDLKSANALYYLYEKGFDEHSLSQLLSIGVTGLKKNRKLVPTRNSITAVDDNTGRFLLQKIRNYNQISNFTLYFGGHYGNFYMIMFFPEIFSYELFETVFPKTTWNPSPYSDISVMTDYENYHGRKDYAEETSGGYYAARLPILQYLNSIKKQASVLTLRFVLPEYDVPLGVWVCRNSARKSLESKPLLFDSKEKMINHAKAFILQSFNFDITDILKQSRLLNEIKKQSKLSKYFS